MTSPDPIAYWNELLASIDAGAWCATLRERMLSSRLHFGGRQLCPFLRPFFLDERDEPRVRHAAETLWTLGERIATLAAVDPDLLADLALSDAEVRLVQIDPGYSTTSTTARADAFVLPDSLQFAEYNGESPAGAGYSQGLAELFSDEPLMGRFRRRFDARMMTPVDRLLEALLESYREWGGTASPPTIAIVDWPDLPTFSEFEMLRDAFTARGVPTVIADPRSLVFERDRLVADGEPIDFVYRRILINDIVAHESDCRALIDAYAARAVCVANSLRCKIPHKKAFFAVLTDETRADLFSPDERDVIRRHIPWTVLVRDRRVVRDGESVELLAYLRRERDRFVLKPNDEYGGTGVTLGWETSESEWDAALSRAIAEADRGWVAQEKIVVRREPFPICDGDGVTMREMLIDFAPYVFRGRLAGFLTRLSATGLANVTSGGGQVPAFVITPRQN
jgi:uncharacterized circularly permuted ATP-grasp superfamily protein